MGFRFISPGTFTANFVLSTLPLLHYNNASINVSKDLAEKNQDYPAIDNDVSIYADDVDVIPESPKPIKRLRLKKRNKIPPLLVTKEMDAIPISPLLPPSQFADDSDANLPIKRRRLTATRESDNSIHPIDVDQLEKDQQSATSDQCYQVEAGNIQLQAVQEIRGNPYNLQCSAPITVREKCFVKKN